MLNFYPKKLVIAAASLTRLATLGNLLPRFVNPGGELEGRKPLEYKDSLSWA